MLSKFQKDLYSKRGSSFDVGDGLIASGLALVLTGTVLAIVGKPKSIEGKGSNQPVVKTESNELENFSSEGFTDGRMIEDSTLGSGNSISDESENSAEDEAKKVLGI